MKIALVSLNQTWENKKDNRLKVLKCLQSISHEKIDLIVFPEMTLTGFTMNGIKFEEELITSETIEFFHKCAYNNSAYIVFGLILKNGNLRTNNLIMISPEKERVIVANYSKIHPFSFAQEDKNYMCGDKLISANLNNTNIGFSICYDLRFPEIFQGLSKDNDIIINIANWPSKRQMHWDILSRARAIENQVFFIGVNRTGIDGMGLEYNKSSIIVSPDGELVKPISSFEEVDIYDIDINYTTICRNNFPIKNDRKIDFYKSIL
ncbi:nitrilase-related carbon-nitrogen hydrolase [Macellibacteroides fermentans]|uniref:nitrilase-related carbon-nitrogen hydrolase n=1 Tax=Macellibacteroides fermentans TaxID=879969 RepID=UPI00406C46D0